MSAFVVDASVVVKWFLPEPDAEAAQRLRRPGLECHAPDLMLLETANTLWKYVTRGALDLTIAQEAIAALSVAPLRLRRAETLFSEAFGLATDTRRSVYDCTYLALAIQTGHLLVTADRRFYDAIKAGPFASHLLWVADVPRRPTSLP